MITHILLIIYVLIILWLIYTIILEYDNRNPLRAISWIFAIIFIPFLGMLAYYIVGRNITKKRSKFKQWRDDFNTQHKRTFKFDKDDPVYKDLKELKHLIYNLEHSPVFSGNNIEVYPSGKIKFEHN